MRSILAIVGVAAFAACSGAQQGGQPAATGSLPGGSASYTIESPPGTPRPPFKFTAEDERLLDEIQHGAFNFLWNAASSETGMVYDRSSVQVISTAGVGFQLAAIPVGVERGWITRDQGRERVEKILRTLADHPDNRKAGMFFHYLKGATGEPTTEAYETAISTIDSAILFAGMITAGQYFGGEASQLTDRLFREADWSFFIARPDTPFRTRPAHDYEMGYISLAWKPDDKHNTTGAGKLEPYFWVDSGDEHKLVAFLAVCAPDPAHRAPDALYYRLRRELGSYKDTGPFVFFPFSGALFTHFFAHCWIDYAAMGPDNPAAFGVDHRARVDWWENSRRATRMHQLKAADNPAHQPTFGENAWGLTACDAPKGYAVPGLFPERISIPGDRRNWDYAPEPGRDDYGDGTIAPYGAGCAILFDPERSLAALRHYRSLKASDGSPLLWRDPASGGYGFQDAFNLGPTPAYVAPDCVAIDQGPLILCIENARTGLIWRLFQSHPAIADCQKRLHFSPRAP